LAVELLEIRDLLTSVNLGNPDFIGRDVRANEV
jgi:hypothetical protein